MRTLDWIVLAASLAGVVLYGLWQSRKKSDIQSYLVANRSMPWWVVFLSVGATQASAITFLSTPGKAYDDGLRFIQFYFGLPLACLILSITAIPIYHKLKVLTAYEYLETRFDAKTRALIAALFLVARALATGMSLYAPALIVSVLLKWPMSVSIALMGGFSIIYTVAGGSGAVAKTQVLQTVIIWGGMAAAVFVILQMLPSFVGVREALDIASVSHKTDWLDFRFDWNNQFNVWSGLIGGLFLQMSYFGTDQSQVARYLAGRSIRESRVGLLAHGITKIPLQFAILFTGIMVFAAYQFVMPPVHFNPAAVEKVLNSSRAEDYKKAEREFQQAFAQRQGAIENYIQSNEYPTYAEGRLAVEAAEARVNTAKMKVKELVRAVDPLSDGGDSDYVFLRFVIEHLPAGIVGLVLAAVLCASMGACAAQLSALGTTSVVDIYRRFINTSATEKHYLSSARWFTAFWGVFAVCFAQFAGGFGPLIVAVNILGSFFYGTILGVFLSAFYIKYIGGTSVFIAALLSEIVVFAFKQYTAISFMWYTVIGCISVFVFAVALEFIIKKSPRDIQVAGR
ncbi:MAG: sodium:solute symporter [Planctomycetota bacterium]